MNNINLKPEVDGECDLIEEKDYLAKELKKIYQHRKEVNPKLSAAIFHKLAKIYMKQNSFDITKRMICLIKSAVLLNAAITRSPDNVKEIENDLKIFCFEVLHEAGAKHKDADLIKHAKYVTELINKLREKVNQKLKGLAKIPDNIEAEQRKLMEIQKVDETALLLNDVASDYTKIMASVAQYIEEIMGKSPCEFSLIGMGSLARKEITPYSDFENMILLANDHNEYETKLNYFRWYSVIYQIILINLQETIIPSVSIECLNDKNSKYGDWFYDDITIQGICFDGMMPHACKFPLGRQPTHKKPWKTELIKSVNEMLKYLNNEESLKIGYHLSTILTKTCYVFGNLSIYEEFEKGVHDLIEQEKSETIQEVVKKQITEDLGRFATRQSLLKINPTKTFNVKQVVYRSTTALIAGLGQLYKVSANSCFEILIKLQDKKHISENTKQKLLFAVALACELRLKLYMSNKRQKDDALISTMVDLIGEQSTLRYFQISYALQCDISKRLNLKKVHLYSNPNLLNFSLAHCLDDYDQMKRIALDAKQTSSQRYYDFDECFSKMEKALMYVNQKNFEPDQSNTNEVQSKFENFQKIANVLMKLQYSDDAFEYFQKCLDTLGYTELYFQEGLESKKLYHSKPDFISCRQIAQIIYSAGLCLQKLSRFEKASTYFLFSLKIAEECDAVNIVAETVQNLGKCYIELNRFKFATKYLKKHLSIRTIILKDIGFDPVYAETLYEIGRCSYLNRDHVNAVPFLEQSIQIRKNISADIETDLNAANTLFVLSACLSRLHQHKKADHTFNKAHEICEKAIPREPNQSYVAHTMFWMGLSLLNMQKIKKATKMFEKTLELVKKISLDFTADRKVSDIFFQLGRCCLNQRKAEIAKSYFEEALKIDEVISHNLEKDEIFATSLDMVGRCLLSLKKPEEAIVRFERALKVYSNLPHNDRNIANLTSWIGFCNLKLKNVEKAKDYFHKALQVVENAPFRHGTYVTSTAHMNLGLGRCLFNLKRSTEALSKLKKALEKHEEAAYNKATDYNIANACFWIGRCLLDMNNRVKAKDYFEKALQIYIKTSENITNDDYVASTQYWIDYCLIILKKNNINLECSAQGNF